MAGCSSGVCGSGRTADWIRESHRVATVFAQRVHLWHQRAETATTTESSRELQTYRELTALPDSRTCRRHSAAMCVQYGTHQRQTYSLACSRSNFRGVSSHEETKNIWQCVVARHTSRNIAEPAARLADWRPRRSRLTAWVILPGERQRKSTDKLGSALCAIKHRGRICNAAHAPQVQILSCKPIKTTS